MNCLFSRNTLENVIQLIIRIIIMCVPLPTRLVHVDSDGNKKRSSWAIIVSRRKTPSKWLCLKMGILPKWLSKVNILKMMIHHDTPVDDMGYTIFRQTHYWNLKSPFPFSHHSHPRIGRQILASYDMNSLCSAYSYTTCIRVRVRVRACVRVYMYIRT